VFAAEVGVSAWLSLRRGASGRWPEVGEDDVCQIALDRRVVGNGTDPELAPFTVGEHDHDLAPCGRLFGLRLRVFVPLLRETVSPEIPPNASGQLEKSLHAVSAPVSQVAFRGVARDRR
jgi:hypothetical protein